MLSQACQRCWHRKQKCDRQSPECSTCVAAGVKCLPRVWGRVLSSDTDEAGAHNPARSPIEYLKWRISYLENESSQESTDSSTPQYERLRHASTTRGSQTSPGEVAIDDSGSVRAPADVTSNEVEYLSLTAMSGGGKNDQGQGQGLTLSQIMTRLVSIRGVNPGSVTLDVAPSAVQGRASLTEIEREIKILVGKDFSYLVNTFTRIATWCFPCLSETECLAALSAASHWENNATPQALPTSTPGTEATASCVLALGGTMSPFQDMLHPLLLRIVDSSKQALSEVLTTASDAIAIQCLVLQTSLSLYHPSAGSAWHLLGLALTKAISAGLHRSSPTSNTNEEVGHSEDLFWTLYLLDRTIAISMGRPFGLEDDDIALRAPEIFMPPSSADVSAVSRALFVWKLHHALLQSQWRHQSTNFDLDASFASYEYWKDSYRDICARLVQVEKTEMHGDGGHGYAPSSALLLKDEAQLACRMLVHLLDQAARKLHFHDASLVRFKGHVVEELPGLIEVLHKSMENENVALTFLDGYDAFATAVMYVFCIYDPRQPSVFRLGMTQMRTVTASIDIVQHVAQQFKPLRRFKDVIWALLHALEARAEGRSAGRLENELTRYEVAIPNHVRRALEVCMESHVE